MKQRYGPGCSCVESSEVSYIVAEVRLKITQHWFGNRSLHTCYPPRQLERAELCQGRRDGDLHLREQRITQQDRVAGTRASAVEYGRYDDDGVLRVCDRRDAVYEQCADGRVGDAEGFGDLCDGEGGAEFANQ